MEKVRIVGIVGSVRKDSYNGSLMATVGDLGPDRWELAFADLAPIPFYNADEEAMGLPGAVVAFKALLASADAVLIASPEYNGGMPGLLKNALDWASRRPSGLPLKSKPVGLMGASPGGFGTVRAQPQIRGLCSELGMYPLNGTFLVSRAHQHIEEGRLKDASLREKMTAWLGGFDEWIGRCR